MKAPPNAWWIALALFLAPALYAAFSIRRFALGQGPRINSIALSMAENPEPWKDITLEGQHPLQVHQDLALANEMMLVASTLATALLTAACLLLAAGWAIARRRVPQSPSGTAHTDGLVAERDGR